MWYSILIFVVLLLVYSRIQRQTNPTAATVAEELHFLEIGLKQVENLASQVEEEEVKQSVAPLLERARVVFEDMNSTDFTEASGRFLSYASKLIQSAARDVTKARNILSPYFEDDDWND